VKLGLLAMALALYTSDRGEGPGEVLLALAAAWRSERLAVVKHGVTMHRTVTSRMVLRAMLRGWAAAMVWTIEPVGAALVWRASRLVTCISSCYT
jgi:hypothetical protein